MLANGVLLTAERLFLFSLNIFSVINKRAKSPVSANKLGSILSPWLFALAGTPLIKDESSMSPEKYAISEMLKSELNDVLKTLTEREEKVLRLRFGIDDGQSLTLEEVGKIFGVTRERIRQIESKALRKLKHPSRSKKLKDFLIN